MYKTTLMNRTLHIATIAAGIAAAACSSIPGAWTSEELHTINGQPEVMRVLTVDSPSDSLLLRQDCINIPSELLAREDYKTLARKMVATVTSPEQDGVGIAGPQVGLSRRIVAVKRYDLEGEPFLVFPNIRITEYRGETEPGPEGCLSVPGKRGTVLRYRDIDIRYTSPKTLKDTTERITGFTAVIFQHECDHLDGIIYTDKLCTAPVE